MMAGFLLALRRYHVAEQHRCQFTARKIHPPVGIPLIVFTDIRFRPSIAISR
ncbi:hypothetical protein KCP69_15825 [Salmonella enterica subsp. enterica]|nr:hypothetical protein KCP69_15825 [Salmonella enterica subsp. enterica]